MHFKFQKTLHIFAQYFIFIFIFFAILVKISKVNKKDTV